MPNPGGPKKQQVIHRRLPRFGGLHLDCQVLADVGLSYHVGKTCGAMGGVRRGFFLFFFGLINPGDGGDASVSVKRAS